MREFDLEAAFDRVLDVAIDARVEMREAIGKLNESCDRVRELERSNAANLSRANHLQQEAERALPKLSALHQSADAITVAILGCGGMAFNEDIQGKLTALRKALKEAGSFCDEIPF